MTFCHTGWHTVADGLRYQPTSLILLKALISHTALFLARGTSCSRTRCPTLVQAISSTESCSKSALACGISCFFNELKVFEKLLQHPGRKERLMATCMEGTPFSEYMPVIKTFSYTLHTPRWSAVALFCSAAVKPIGLLRRCWNHSAYEAKGVGTYLEKSFENGADKRFRPADVSPLLKQPLFRAYLVLVICIHGLGRRLNAWFRACPCHAQIWKKAGSNAHMRKKLFKQDGLACGRCPLAGCRGWEIADDKFESVLQEIRDQTLSALMEQIEKAAA